MPVIRRFASRIEAELAAAFLRSNGLDASTHNDDAGGLHPELAYGIGGSRVVVPGDQQMEASTLLDEVDASSADTTGAPGRRNGDILPDDDGDGGG